MPTGARSKLDRNSSTASARAIWFWRMSVRSWQIPSRWRGPLPSVAWTAPRIRSSRRSPSGRSTRANESKVPSLSRAAATSTVMCSRSSDTISS